MKAVVNGDPAIGVHGLLVLLEVIEEVEEDAFKVVMVEAVPKDELSGVGVDGWTNLCAFEVIPCSSYSGVDIKDGE